MWVVRTTLISVALIGSFIAVRASIPPATKPAETVDIFLAAARRELLQLAEDKSSQDELELLCGQSLVRLHGSDENRDALRKLLEKSLALPRESYRVRAEVTSLVVLGDKDGAKSALEASAKALSDSDKIECKIALGATDVEPTIFRQMMADARNLDLEQAAETATWFGNNAARNFFLSESPKPAGSDLFPDVSVFRNQAEFGDATTAAGKARAMQVPGARFAALEAIAEGEWSRGDDKSARGYLLEALDEIPRTAEFGKTSLLISVAKHASDRGDAEIFGRIAPMLIEAMETCAPIDDVYGRIACFAGQFKSEKVFESAVGKLTAMELTPRADRQIDLWLAAAHAFNSDFDAAERHLAAARKRDGGLRWCEAIIYYIHASIRADQFDRAQAITLETKHREAKRSFLRISVKLNTALGRYERAWESAVQLPARDWERLSAQRHILREQAAAGQSRAAFERIEQDFKGFDRALLHVSVAMRLRPEPDLMLWRILSFS